MNYSGDFGAAPPVAPHTLLSHSALPAFVIDLDAIERNAADLTRRAGTTPIRLATKSVRIPELISYVLARPGYQGVLAYSLREALWLFENSISDDIVVAYPTVDAEALSELAANAPARAAICLMVDRPEHLAALADAVAVATADTTTTQVPGVAQTPTPDTAPVDRSTSAAATVRLRVAIDVDASYRPVPGVHIGALRSSVHTPAQAAKLARDIVSRPYLHLSGIMMYEAQIAGVGNKGSSFRARAIRWMQSRSIAELAQRRAQVVAAVEKVAGPLEFVNGGGTGSLESTCAEAAVTEAAAGSGILAPALFDTYVHFQPTPASWFVTAVTRKPKRGIITVAGGGRLASGPGAADRMPLPAYPPGLHYTANEGAGEVQTPLRGRSARRLNIGDLVWFRHVKAGEACEHANAALVVRDGKVIDRWETYRGKGLIFV